MKNKIKTGILLNAAALGVLHLANCFISQTASLKGLLSDDHGHYFNWRFGRVFYTKIGSGAPLILLHDLSPESSGYEWNLVEKRLAEDYTVYTIDLLGCGRSDKPAMTYTNYLYVQLISEFITKVVCHPVHAAATGLSGSFLVMACASNPALFEKLILVNPKSLNELSAIPSQRSKIQKYILELPIIGTTLYHMIAGRENTEYLFTEKYFYNPFSIQKKLLHVYYEAAHRGDSRGKYLLASLDGRYLNINIAAALKKIDKDTMLIMGEKYDNARRIAESYKALNPVLETAYIPEAKQLPQLEASQLTYANMEYFLDEG